MRDKERGVVELALALWEENVLKRQARSIKGLVLSYLTPFYSLVERALLGRRTDLLIYYVAQYNFCDVKQK